jgi:C1A family cysteine protease
MMLCSVSVAISAAAYAPNVDKPVDQSWEDYKAKYKKTYKDADDENARYALFNTAKTRVSELNKLNGKAGHAFGINWSSDRYPQEQFKKGLRKPKDWVPTAPVLEYSEPRRNPASINWRYTEAVTAIKNQGQCGSCWAFSATEAVESQMILGTGGKLAVALSPQQITSCTPNSGTYGCLGCEGGFTEGAYDYLKNAPVLANSFYIPYQQSLVESSATMACPEAKVEQINGPLEQLSGGYAQVTGYHYATPPCTAGGCMNQNLEKLAQALEQTPVSICVNAGPWNDYVGGIMSAAACPADAALQDHCVMATGFNTTAPTPYWIVRNSWASTWGEEGYIYLEMGDFSKNTCGLADDATIPQVKLDLSEAEAAEAAANREAMYQRATMTRK